MIHGKRLIQTNLKLPERESWNTKTPYGQNNDLRLHFLINEAVIYPPQGFKQNTANSLIAINIPVYLLAQNVYFHED